MLIASSVGVGRHSFATSTTFRSSSALNRGRTFRRFSPGALDLLVIVIRAIVIALFFVLITIAAKVQYFVFTTFCGFRDPIALDGFCCFIFTLVIRVDFFP